MTTTAPAPALTKGQQEGADAFYRFLMSDAKTFVLAGGAGVGKTFLMAYLIEHVMEQYRQSCKLFNIPQLYHKIHFTATTHKAAEVLEHSIKRPVSTIHSLLGLRVQNDYRTGKQKLTPTQKTSAISQSLIFIDESSMIDTQLYALIKDLFQDSKVIFVGDPDQMSPVGEAISPVYTDVDPQNYVFLSEPVRNAGSPELIALCAQLRETVETGIFRPMIPDGIAIRHLSKREMEEKVTEIFQENHDPDARILCYTNSRVEAFNAAVREIQGLTPEMQEGDVVVTANTTVIGDNTLNVEREVNILGIEEEPKEFQAFGMLYQLFKIRDPFGTILSIRVPCDKQRWLELIKYTAQNRDWDLHFQLKESFTDLRFKAACTVYKSQGSTYETVFIDIGNIGTSYDANQVARMLFVGASRATTHVYLFGNLPRYYQGV